MYLPYLRGKQYELILLREQATLLAGHNIHPIIEPVRRKTTGLVRAVQELDSKSAQYSVILNPGVGDYAGDANALISVARDEFHLEGKLSCGVLLSEATTREELDGLRGFSRYTFVHSGQMDPKLNEELKRFPEPQLHVFAESQTGPLYRKRFGDRSVLLSDGFNHRDRNADHAKSECEHFSDFHAVYRGMGMVGFADFLTVGDKYQEGGGPAYAVALHLTFIDTDESMHICHFLSDRRDSPKDTAGKFLEALRHLVDTIQSRKYPILKTAAVKEFLDLNRREHFPGLGYIKKLSMQHHIELIADYLGR